MHKIIGTLTVSDNYNKDLFRIHLYEDCIKFDSKFAEGVGQIDALTEKLNEITKSWIDKEITSSEVLKDVVLVLEVYNDDLKKYYFSDDELNKLGKYIDLVPIDSLLLSLNEDATRYYKYLLREQMLDQIEKKSFESNLKDERYLDLYLEIYNGIKNKNVKYYKYDLNKNFDFKSCNFILADDKVVFGYVY